MFAAPEALVARALAHASRRQIAQRHAPPGVPPASGLGLHTEPTLCARAGAAPAHRQRHIEDLAAAHQRAHVRVQGAGARRAHRVVELSTLARPADRAR
jgi:hypothetical protein